MTTKLFDTDNGDVFNITLDAGYCFAMCLDLAKVILIHIRDGKATKLPHLSELTPGKWAIVQSSYEINDHQADSELVEAQGFTITNLIEGTVDSGLKSAVNEITKQSGTSVFSVLGKSSGHSLLWHRDDENDFFLYLDPNEGLYRFSDVEEGRKYVAKDVAQGYPKLNKKYDSFTLALD